MCDFEKMLKAYIQHIICEEGIDYLAEWRIQESSSELMGKLSVEEAQKLIQLAESVSFGYEEQTR